MKKRLFAFFALCLLGVTLWGQSLPDAPSPARLVNDFAGLLSPAQQDSLERKLTRFDRNTSTQIAVVTVTDLEGLAAGDYAQRLFEKWGIGRKGKDNGVLILIKPKTADSKGEAFISVGYGLEGVIPDITAGRIIDTEMLPAFQQGDIFTGLNKATTVLMQLSAGEFTADQYNGGKDSGVAVGFFIIVALLILFGWLGRGHRGSGGNNSHGGGRGWVPPFIIGGGSSFGGGDGGSFGGFGGFGGGSSGGGGGGRSW